MADDDDDDDDLDDDDLPQVMEESEDGPAPPATATPGVVMSTASFSDAPAQEDKLGFAPYVRAIAWFLIDPKTEPPLTLSIEGPWGSGKSSFMLQLGQRLHVLAKARTDVGDVRCVWFNPWKNDKDESLWASFALTLIKQLESHTPWRQRLMAKARLTALRIDWAKLGPTLASLAVFGLATVALLLAPQAATWIVERFPIFSVEVARILPAALTGLATLSAAGLAVRHGLGNPLPKSLKDYIRNPRFEDRISLIERFGAEFHDILEAYAGVNGRVFAFIDDLDRCEVPRAAELMQAINLLMSSDLKVDFQPKSAKAQPHTAPRLIFVLGIDREMVAAGIAAKNATVLPYLAQRRSERPAPEPASPAAGASAPPAAPDTSRFGLEFGFAFLEKFIQTPFHLPRVREDQLKVWIKDMVGVTDPAAAGAPKATIQQTAAPGADRGALLAGQDPVRFEDIVTEVATAFRFSPRQVKQFLNVLRLQIAIAIQTGQLEEAPTIAAGGIAQGLTLERLALVSAIFLEWPSLVGRIFEAPDFLTQAERSPAADDVPGLWEVISALGPAYSLVGLDITKLVEVLPDVYPNADLGPGGGQRSRLVPRAGDPTSDGPTPTADVAVSATQGPSGGVAGPSGAAA